MLRWTLPAKTADMSELASESVIPGGIDQWELSEFTDRMIADLATTMHAATVVVGLRLGLYAAMAEAGPATPAVLAAAAGCDERYMMEWLAAQAAAGYCEYDDETGRFALSEAQEACLADESSPAFLAAGQLIVSGLLKNEDRLTEALRSGCGVAWADQHHDLAAGFARFSRASYRSHLVDSWVPALEGVAGRLAAGGLVADVGCGHGGSTTLLASAFPAATIVGFDPHRPSVEAARKAAVDAGAGDRVAFEVASAQDFPGSGYQLVCTFDALHDMGDPVGAATHIRSTLADDGTWLLVEPMAGETVADNLTDVGRLFYSASTLVCTPSARSQPGGWALGAQASEAQLRGLCRRAGLTRFRRAAETRLHRVYDVKP
jgi:SAM-dependent methyltransferase